MQDEWGNSAFARQEKRRAREREKKRRQRAVQALRVSQPATISRALENRTYEVFVTASGLSAVRSRIRQIAWSGEPRPPISMPYVPFLHGRSVGEVR